MKRIYVEITSDGLTLGKIGHKTIEQRMFVKWEYGEVLDGALYNVSRLFSIIVGYVREKRLSKAQAVVSSIFISSSSPIYLFPIILSIKKTGLLIGGIYGESLLSEKGFMKFKNKEGEGLDFFTQFRAPIHKSPYGWLTLTGVIVGIVASLSAWLYVEKNSEISWLREEVASLESVVLSATKEHNKLHDLRTSDSLLQKKIIKCGKERARLCICDKVLKIVSDTIPDDTWLERFSFDKVGKKIEEKPTVVSLVGASLSDYGALEFYKRLAESTHMKKLHFDRFDGLGASIETDSKEDGDCCKFEFSCNI